MAVDFPDPNLISIVERDIYTKVQTLSFWEQLSGFVEGGIPARVSTTLGSPLFLIMRPKDGDYRRAYEFKGTLDLDNRPKWAKLTYELVFAQVGETYPIMDQTYLDELWQALNRYVFTIVTGTGAPRWLAHTQMVAPFHQRLVRNGAVWKETGFIMTVHMTNEPNEEVFPDFIQTAMSRPCILKFQLSDWYPLHHISDKIDAVVFWDAVNSWDVLRITAEGFADVNNLIFTIQTQVKAGTPYVVYCPVYELFTDVWYWDSSSTTAKFTEVTFYHTAFNELRFKLIIDIPQPASHFGAIPH